MAEEEKKTLFETIKEKLDDVADAGIKIGAKKEEAEAKKAEEEAAKVAEEAKKAEEEAKKSKETLEKLAKECIRGDWGNGTERKEKLEAAGYDYHAVQTLVNEMLEGK